MELLYSDKLRPLPLNHQKVKLVTDKSRGLHCTGDSTLATYPAALGTNPSNPIFFSRGNFEVAEVNQQHCLEQ